MKLAKVFLPAIALMTIALGGIPARAAEKVKIAKQRGHYASD